MALQRDRVMNKTLRLINPDSGGGNLVRTIKFQYYKNSVANFLLQTQRGATGVMIEYDV